MDDYAPVEAIAIALGLGLLVGLQRERKESAIAGIRTFGVISVFGALSALLVPQVGGWIVPVGLLVVFGAMALGNVTKVRAGVLDPGQTTEVAALLMYAIGAYVVLGSVVVAIVVAAVLALVLYLKEPLHRWVQALGEADLRAAMQLVVLSMVVLPVLPRRAFGPYDVLNPFEVWLIVVLIATISFLSYVLYRRLGTRSATLISGLLGGLVSSTATTVSYARQSRGSAASARLAAVVVVIAAAVVFGRVLVELAIVAPAFAIELGAPLLAMGAWVGLLGTALWWRVRGQAVDVPERQNPAELKTALSFGVLYALVLLAVAYAKDAFGTTGVYVAAVLSGLTDMDAITLSTAKLVRDGVLPADEGWRVILAAAMSNLVFKAAMALSLGAATLRRAVAVAFALALAGGGLLLWLWP